MKQKIYIAIAGVALIFLGAMLPSFFKGRKINQDENPAYSSDKLTEITWMDLQKLDLKTNKLPDDIATKLSGPVKLPGFIVPLEASVDRTTHFLFVPNQAYCVHVPPPPANLMVEVNSKDPVLNKELQGPIWIEGYIRLENGQTQFGTASWQFKATAHRPYELPK